MSIASTETFFIDLIKARFHAAMMAVESMPADWDSKTFERAMRMAPGVFVVFNGGSRLDGYGDALVIAAKWTFVVVTTHAQGDLARRHGDAREIGAFEMIEILLSLLEGVMPPDATQAMEVEAVANLFSDSDEAKGATLYAIECVMPQAIGPSAENPTDPNLDDFIRFHGNYDIAPGDGQVDASDVVTLPTGAP